MFSPDGRFVAYMSNESGRSEIYVRPFARPFDFSTGSGSSRVSSRDDFAQDRPAASGAALRLRSGQAANAAGGQWQVSTAGGIVPRWRRDGKELYYLNPAGAMMAAPITVTGSTVAPGAPVALFPTRIYAGGADAAQGRQYDVTRDGRFLINTVLDAASAPITLLMNWHPEAKK